MKIADQKALRKLNEAFINSLARVERAELAREIARKERDKARCALDEALAQYGKDDDPHQLNESEKALIRSGIRGV